MSPTYGRYIERAVQICSMLNILQVCSMFKIYFFTDG